MKTAIFIYIAIAAACIYGWIHNIVLLTRMDCGFCAHEIIRVIGIFVAPIGILMGYIGN